MLNSHLAERLTDDAYKNPAEVFGLCENGRRAPHPSSGGSPPITSPDDLSRYRAQAGGGYQVAYLASTPRV